MNGQDMAGAAAKGKTGAAWMETLGVLWLGAVAAGAATAAQACPAGDSATGLLPFIALLAYPVLWVTRGRAATLVWTVSGICWLFIQCEEAPWNQALLLGGAAGILALSAAAWAFAARSRGEGGPTAAVRTGMGLAYAFGLPLAVVVILDARPWRIPDAWYFAVFFAAVALIGLAGRLTGHRAWRVAGTLAAVGTVLAVFATRTFGAPQWLLHVWRCGSLYGSLAYALALSALGFFRSDRWMLNAGMLLGAWLVVEKFCASRLDVTAKCAVAMVACAAVWAVNAWLVRMAKREAAA